MTDDQGYGDLGCHGNRQIRTPNLDALYAESVRMTDYHVDPTCSPTRSALITGRYSSRTGVWHTIMGHSILHKDETTIAQAFQKAGYRTGIFGKWHLGDCWPYRPQDRGFEEVLIHGGGGVGQTPDYWGNDYFDDTYWHNGEPTRFDGYCTDVWFDGALDFIQANRERPFFAYVATNAPHGPYLVDPKYSQPYKQAGIPSPRAEFYGMITNIDENIARLRRRLDDLGLAENTILIFTTDNGSAAGANNRGGFNAGMRGTKGSEYDGGHRVPFFVHWPAGGLSGGRDIDALTAHIDVLPTLAELCGVEIPDGLDLDGRSLVPLLKQSDGAGRPERTLVVHSQRIEHPEKWRKSAVMTPRWRLVNGEELYDIQADPGQERDVSAEHPQVIARLRQEYDRWWEHIDDRFDDYCRIPLGDEQANPTHFTCHDWHAEMNQVPWSQAVVARNPEANGRWAVDVLRDGRYEITLRLRPEHVGYALPTGTARVKIGTAEASRPIAQGATSVTIPLDLHSGPATMQTWLEGADGTSRGAFFVEARYAGE
jgi:arylsulfatase A-like enzyme